MHGFYYSKLDYEKDYNIGNLNIPDYLHQIKKRTDSMEDTIERWISYQCILQIAGEPNMICCPIPEEDKDYYSKENISEIENSDLEYNVKDAFVRRVSQAKTLTDRYLTSEAMLYLINQIKTLNTEIIF